MVCIHGLRKFARFRRYVKTRITLFFARWPVHVIFPFVNNGWMINFVNSNSCIFLKQQSKGLIIAIVVFRCELIPKKSTNINILQGIYKWSNWVTSDHYRIPIVHIDSMYTVLGYKGILQSFRIFFNCHKKIW